MCITKNLHTIQDLLRWTFSRFNTSLIHYGHGNNNALQESMQLILQSLSLPIDFPEKFYSSRLTHKEKIKIIKKVNKRIIKRIPVAYLTNKSWFCKLEFYVDNRVFIPRSPIGEIIINHFQNLISYSPTYILDMCTGSGCIAIACSYIYPKAKIDAVDISKHAIEVAEYNILYHNVENKVVPIHSNLFEKLPNIKYDLIIANPPYVNKKNSIFLPKEYNFEPSLSLFAKKNGLEFIIKILNHAANYLSNRGILICEVGENMKILQRKYPDIPFHWIKLKNGGKGVFSLTKKQLLNHKYFKY